MRASAARKLSATSPPAGTGVVATGSSSRKRPCSGMHSFSHTTQSASASTVKRVPGRAAAGTVTVNGSTIASE